MSLGSYYQPTLIFTSLVKMQNYKPFMSIHKCESTLMSSFGALSKRGVSTLQLINEITHSFYFRFCINPCLKHFLHRCLTYGKQI